MIDAKRRTTAAGKGQRLSVKLINEAGEEVRIAGTDRAVNISFPQGAVIAVRDGQQVQVGEVLARIPQEVSKTRDITGGLPRVAELFEARSPKDAGKLAEVTGGELRQGHQGQAAPGDHRPRQAGARVPDRQGQASPGARRPGGEQGRDDRRRSGRSADLLRLLGVEELARYIIDEVQDVYRLQGVKINDKHIEVIVRQMPRRVEITDPGETTFITGEQAERPRCSRRTRRPRRKEETRGVRLHAARHHQGSPRPTRSSPRLRSRRRRASTEAAIMGKRDGLRGLKENVIVGRLIPAGTGMAYHNIRKAQAAEPVLAEIPAAAPKPRPRKPPRPPAAAAVKIGVRARFPRNKKGALGRPLLVHGIDTSDRASSVFARLRKAPSGRRTAMPVSARFAAVFKSWLFSIVVAFAVLAAGARPPIHRITTDSSIALLYSARALTRAMRRHCSASTSLRRTMG